MKAQLVYTFEKVYKEESDAIFRFCFLRVSRREEALDITQETFLRLWQTMRGGKIVRNKRTFLFTIAHHLIIDWYRKKKSISLDMIIEERVNGEQDLFEDTFHTKDTELAAEGRYLLDKLNELPETYRQPVYLRFVEDMSPKDIGKILGISTNATSVRINRGLFELRKKTGYTEDSNHMNTENGK
jgi:RNA polymerase sigma-70 factor, ECF subfamily